MQIVSHLQITQKRQRGRLHTEPATSSLVFLTSNHQIKDIGWLQAASIIVLKKHFISP